MENKTHILLAVSGMTPQIITETVYGIYCQDPAKLPKRIEVITTQGGKERLINNLLCTDSPLQQLISDYKLPPITFNEHNIKVPNNDNGKPLYDVKTEREQEVITDYITNHVRKLSADDNTVIHASLAGGRKTMGFALGYAMSLFGRPQDSLSHVLVSEPYENVPDFYYPTPVTIMRADRDKKAQHDLSKAVVTLAKIPLVLMREEMPTQLMNDATYTYTQTVERINRANQLGQEDVTVKLDFERFSIYCDGIEVPLKPDCFAFYSWLAQDSKENQNKGINAPNEKMEFKDLDDRMYFFLTAFISPNTPKIQALNELVEYTNDLVYQSNNQQNWLLKVGKENEFFFEKSNNRDKTKLYSWHKNLWDRLLRETNKSIIYVLGKKLATHYQITNVRSEKPEKGSRHKRVYKGLNIGPDNINW